MGENRDIPLIGKVLQGSYVIKVAMGHDDRRRPRIRPEALRRSLLDKRSCSDHTGIDKHPSAVAAAGLSEENHVDDRKPPVSEVPRNFLRPVVTRCVGLRLVGDCRRAERYLSHIASPRQSGLPNTSTGQWFPAPIRRRLAVANSTRPGHSSAQAQYCLHGATAPPVSAETIARFSSGLYSFDLFIN